MWNHTHLLAVSIAACVLSVSAAPSRTEKIERFEFESYTDIAALFERLNYTEAAWQAGVREVPRVFLTDVPPRWRDNTSKSVTVKTKKELFFRALAPLALRANEMILADRDRLAALRKAPLESISQEDSAWLSEMAFRYDLAATDDAPVSPAQLEELWARVDLVPVSLALSQAAEESGWGTSRFASQGNALFGQWTWGPNAMKPKEQRAKLGNYGIRSFETPLESMAAYMLNLNTHRAYAQLRAKRAGLRAAGQQPTGWALAETLNRYSERGEAYVKSLHGIMRVNRLNDADEAHLAEEPDIYLVPVGTGASR